MSVDYYLKSDDKAVIFHTLLESVLGKLTSSNFMDKNYIKIFRNYQSHVKELDAHDDIDEIALKTIDFTRDSLLYLKFTDGLAFDLLKAWKSYEDIIYLTRSSYRDHFMHQFYVFLLGTLLLPEIYNNILNDKKKNPPQSENKQISKNRFFRRWFLASMFHDIGYPAETLKDISNTLNHNFFNKIPNYGIPKIEMITFHEDKTLNNLIESISRIHFYSEFINYENIFSTSDNGENKPRGHRRAIEELNNLFYDEIKTTVDHGVNSAIFLLKTALIDIREMVFRPEDIETIFKEPLTDLLEDLYISASAMAGHNLRSYTYPGFTVDFGSRPIASLLNFCDDLQEWDRRPHDHDWEKRACKLLTIGTGYKDKKLTQSHLNKPLVEYKNVFEVNELYNKDICSHLYIDLKMHSKPHHDETFRVNQKSLMDNLSHLFKNNLSDKSNIFFDVVQVSGFSCGADFIAVLEKDENHYLHGRYHTSLLRKKKNKLTYLLHICDEEEINCFRCDYLNKKKKKQI